jgi:hypothetical protein
MNKAEICGSNGHALEVVLDPKTTLRYVRRPDLQPCWLTLWTAEAGTLVVEIDGDKASAHPLTAHIANRISLKELAAPRSKLFSLINPLSLRGGKKKTGSQNEPEEFTVFVRRGDEEGVLLRTYSFKLMSEAAYDTEFGRSGDKHESTRQEPNSYTTDARSPATVHNCWNCQKPIGANACCEKCGCPQEEPESE